MTFTNWECHTLCKVFGHGGWSERQQQQPSPINKLTQMSQFCSISKDQSAPLRTCLEYMRLSGTEWASSTTILSPINSHLGTVSRWGLAPHWAWINALKFTAGFESLDRYFHCFLQLSLVTFSILSPCQKCFLLHFTTYPWHFRNGNCLAFSNFLHR